MAATRYIDAGHLLLSLVARRVHPSVRWCAMSNGASTSDCKARRWVPPYYLPKPSLMHPLYRGYIERAIDQIRWREGAKGVRRVFGCGIRALQAELAPRKGAC